MHLARIFDGRRGNLFAKLTSMRVIEVCVRRGHWVIIVVAMCLGISASRAATGNLDPSFVFTGRDASEVTTVQPDGKILVGGLLSYFVQPYRTIFENHLVRLHPDGSLDSSFDANLAQNCRIRGLVVLDDGVILVAGYFDVNENERHWRVAKMSTNGTLDPTFDLAADNEINSMVRLSDGSVIVAGSFTTLGGSPRTSIARIRPDGVLDPSFIVPMAGAVYSATVQADGRILIGGYIATVHGEPRQNLARLNSDGSLDTNFDAGRIEGQYGAYDGAVHAVACQPDGRVLIGGFFKTVAGVSRRCLARLMPSGAADSTFNTDVSRIFDSYPYVMSIVLQADGQVVIGGKFNLVNGSACTNCARLSAGGVFDSSFTPNLYEVSTLSLQEDGRLVVGAGIPNRPESMGRVENDAAITGLTISPSRVDLARGGTAPEIQAAEFSLSVDGGQSWTPLGAGTRVSTGWTKDGLSLPGRGTIRARMRLNSNGASTYADVVAAFPDTTVTQVPTLVLPAPGAVQGTGSLIRYSLPETARSGSVKLHYQPVGGGATTDLLVGSDGETAGSHTIVFNPLTPTSVPSILSGAPLADGRYHVSLSYRDAVGNTEAFSLISQNVAIAAQPYSRWKIGLLDDILAPDTGNPDGDGYTNLAEYALVLSPDSPEQGPSTGVGSYGEGNRLRVLFKRDPARNDVTIDVQAADSLLGEWQVIATCAPGALTTGPGYVFGDSPGTGLKTIEVRDVINLGDPEHTQRFLRIKVRR